MGAGLDRDLSKMLQRSARGSLILIVGQLVSTLITALGTIIVARFLGSAKFGIISIANIPISMALLFVNNGVSQALMKFLAQYRHENQHQNLKTMALAGFLLNLTVSSALTVLVYALSGYLANQVFHEPELQLLIQVLSFSIFAHALVNMSYAVFVGYERMVLRSLTNITYSILKSVLAPLLVLLGYGAFGAAIGNTAPLLISGLIGLALVMFIVSKEEKEDSSLPLSEAVRTIIAFSYPLFFSSLIGGLNQVFNFLLPLYVEPSVIGNFSAALNFTVLVSFFTAPISTALFPLFSKLEQSEDGALRMVFQNAVKYMSLVTFPITTAIIALSPQIIQALYESSYMQAPFFMKLHMLNFYFIGVGAMTVRNLLTSQKQTQTTFRMTLTQILIGLPLGVYLIPRYGVVGFIATSLVSTKLGLFYGLWWVRRHFRFSVNWAASFKILIAAAVSYAVTTIYLGSVDLNVWVELLSGGVLLMLVYAVLIPFIGAIDRKDVHNIRSITGNFGPLSYLIRFLLGVAERLMRD